MQHNIHSLRHIYGVYIYIYTHYHIWHLKHGISTLPSYRFANGKVTTPPAPRLGCCWIVPTEGDHQISCCWARCFSHPTSRNHVCEGISWKKKRETHEMRIEKFRNHEFFWDNLLYHTCDFLRIHNAVYISMRPNVTQRFPTQPRAGTEHSISNILWSCRQSMSIP